MGRMGRGVKVVGRRRGRNDVREGSLRSVGKSEDEQTGVNCV